ncbi:MAG TPA: ADP-ribosylation factor-like protein [Kofleriaceae bacterium]|nr:ADP-ribosylation factor-like protein [Kofleriaceae bacterium]
MAVLDSDRDAIVIRIVYDGPPHAGKTTSMRALARSLGRGVESPGEADERTLFFDWMEYTGGLFEGHQIRCQVVSVPGQRQLAARRRALLDTADAVVFVADTADADAIARSAVAVRELFAVLRGKADPPIGVVVQANKRDLPGAVSRAELRAALGAELATIAVTESIAGDGDGIRETFVFAVRLALDRIRELIARGTLPRGTPDVDSAAQLLAALERQPLSSASTDDFAAPAIAPGVPRPRLPDARVPSGAIWPPVEGRAVLHEATTGDLTVQRVGDGDWIAGLGSDWRVHSAAAAAFDDVDDGRRALLTWARLHAAHGELLSPSRCVVLAAADARTWRLWQIIRRTPSLRAWLVDGRALDAAELLDRLAAAAAVFGEACRRFADPLPVTLDTVGDGLRGVQFVALMPRPGASPARLDDVAAHIVRQLSQLLAADLSERRGELAQRVSRRRAARTPWDDLVAAALAESPPPVPGSLAHP